ncbi:MAG: VWA domain-containing protein [Oscillospiraceae bacterium]|jgi:hypothetical protein|nr:VWA domain-containing protein [Oscillospiraceae bacterium]
MQWITPSGGWAFIAAIAILCLYILKQKREPLEVSSTLLWRKALASPEADRPFQKLRRSLLLLVQLLLAVLLAFSLMRPATLGTGAQELIFVFDLSASMQAADGDGTRLEKAAQDARRRAEGLPEGSRVSILTAGTAASQPLARSADPLAVRRALDALRPENGGADIEGALSLAMALQKELEGAAVIVYSDQPIEEEGLTQPAIGGGLDNRALVSLAAGESAAVARVANYGAAAEITIECYADGVLCDLRTLSLEAGETASITCALPEGTLVAEARIVEPDAIASDNMRFWVSRAAGATTVVLAGRDNVFIETALALRSDVMVLKTTPAEAALVGDHALTVIDGALPEALPAHGALLLIDPDTGLGDLHDAPAALSAATNPLADALNAYLQVDEIRVARFRPVIGGTPIWLAGGQPVLAIEERDGRAVATIGFDLHASNLPLLKEFPIFIQQLLAELAPEPLGAGFTDADCGAALPIAPSSFARSAQVVTPEGRRVSIPVTGGVLADTNAIGVYQLEQIDAAGGETTIPFALHVPALESDVRAVPAAHETAATEAGMAYGREWTPWLIAALLALALIEWWVYRRGY